MVQAIDSLNPKGEPDSIETIKAKKERMTDQEAIVKARGYALADEVGRR